MKIGLPKIRLSRKLLFIVLGMTVLLGGTGAAALYIGSDAIMGKPAENVAGEACTTIQTMVLKTPARRLWLRKYIRMENADGEMRIKTALRIAGLAAKAYQVDLIQVNVLDAKGPATRAEMRGRAIGAEVLIAMNPRYLPQMKAPFVARYFDGQPTAEGRFYGDRVSLDLEDVQKMMGKMKDAPDKVDCAEPEKPAEEAEADKNAHGEKKKEGHEANRLPTTMANRPMNMARLPRKMPMAKNPPRVTRQPTMANRPRKANIRRKLPPKNPVSSIACLE